MHHITVAIGAQLRKGVAEFCVLGVLAQAPMYGWQLAQTLGERGLVASIGTLYPILARLSAEGLVTSYIAESSQGPPRRYYELTTDGRERVVEFRDEWDRFVVAVNDTVGGRND
jgi:PadR family transcriptional regulator PadR